MSLPRWDAAPGDVERCVAEIDTWALALLGTGIVDAFDATDMDRPRLPADRSRPDLRAAGLSGGALLEALDVFAAANWDFRDGRERNLARVPAFSTTQLVAIDTAATILGLDGTPPPSRPHYDAVVMTGGMVRAGIVKPRYLRELDGAGLDWTEGVFLGGFRPFAGDELELAPRLGVEGGNEFDAMLFGMRRAFRLSGEAASDTSGGGTGAGSWRDLSWIAGNRILRVVAAPSSEPAVRRANTADTYRFWAARATGVHSVLVITTPVYVPYQGAAAIEVLGLEFGMSVETVAVSAAASDLGADTQPFLPHHRLQELRSAVRGMRLLRYRLVSRD